MENNNMEQQNTAQQEKTFTQEQLNAIVGKRLAEQKQQLEADFMKKEQELNRREISIRAKELLAEKGLPKELADVLRYDDEESLVKAIEKIEHTKGFKDNTEDAKDKKIIIPNRLPMSEPGVVFDPIATAFKKGNDT